MTSRLPSAPSDGHRSRAIYERAYTLSTRVFDRAGTRSNATAPFKSAGVQVTDSVGHPIYSSKSMGKSDLGGSFFTQKRYVEHAPPRNKSVVQLPNTLGLGYSGYQFALATSPLSFPAFPTGISARSSQTELEALGTTAISRVKPTNPVSGLTAALTELRREGLPHLVGAQTWKERARTAQAAGSEYLNVEFGYMPLANDIASFAYGVSSASDVIKRYKQGIGKNMRRSFEFETERTTKESLIGTTFRPYTGIGGSNMWSGGQSSTGALFRTTRVERKRWFSGCFTYYFPSEIFGSKRMSDYAILAKQLGLEPTPDVLWQVTPWTWAVDWFSNAGDVISNWSAFHIDGLVMRWGYQMEHSIIRDTYSLVGARDVSGDAQPVSDVTFVTETKVRVKATPYGFGIDLGGLSPFRLSILAALGLSRS